MISNHRAPLAILGATSRIAQDFILSAVPAETSFALYARRPEAVSAFLAQNGLPANWLRGTLDRFNIDSIDAEAPPFSGLINSIGVGDPAKAKDMGRLIFQITLDSDKLAIDHLNRFPNTPYVFLSSGAAYGTDFIEPANEKTKSIFNINSLSENEYYGVAKLHAEANHRSFKSYSVIDLRVFNYISRRLDLDARFLITDMIRAIKLDQVFETSDEAMIRDYLHPADFRSLVLHALGSPKGTNISVDAFSQAPISKQELLELMSREFGMKYRIVGSDRGLNATGSKPFYYSTNRAAQMLGYIPSRSSADSISEEVGAILAADRI